MLYDKAHLKESRRPTKLCFEDTVTVLQYLWRIKIRSLVRSYFHLFFLANDFKCLTENIIIRSRVRFDDKLKFHEILPAFIFTVKPFIEKSDTELGWIRRMHRGSGR